MEAWPILNEIALGQQFPAGLDCIIRLFWTCALPVSELAAAIELLLLPVCTQLIEWLLQPCPGRLLAKQYSRDAWRASGLQIAAGALITSRNMRSEIDLKEEVVKEKQHLTFRCYKAWSHK